MKRSTTLWAFIMFINTLIAQTPEITKRYNLPDNTRGRFFPVFNHTGDKLLFTFAGFDGLSMFDLNSHQITNISNDAGSGYEPTFSTDDTRVFYRRTTFENGRKYDAINACQLVNKKITPILTPRRNIRQIRPFGNGIAVSADEQVLKVTFGKNNKENLLYVTTENLKMVLYNGNSKKFLNPAGTEECRYIWVSLSPDKQKILYTAAGKGTYVCNTDGKVTTELGYLNAPVWMNDTWVAGMVDKDDGYQLISSEIVMKNIHNGKQFLLSEKSEKAMYPTAANRKVAWHTEEGKIQIVELSMH